MSEATRRQLRTLLNICVVVALGGGLYGLATSGGPVRLGFLRGALIGLMIVLPLFCWEAFYVDTPRGEWLRRLPFARLLAVKTVIYLAVILVGQELGELLVPTGDTLRLDRSLLAATLFSAAFALVINFVLQIDRMLGRGVLLNFLVGRYHRPREEERIFLFLDLAGSTALAERLGGPRFLELLNQLYHHMAGPILEHRGEIHKYVGDEVIVTWTPAEGLTRAACVRCALAIEAHIAARAAHYQGAFGTVPSFRAGLHIGRVASGELGDLKQEIAFLGDGMNTTARLVEACRAQDRRCIASGALLERLALPEGVTAAPLGPIPLRGKEAPLPLFALSRA
jgi:adenylate cyclase